MSDETPKAAERLLRFFWYLNRFMLALFRLGLGRWVNAWPSVGGRIMVLTHVGRKTGIRRRTPLNYAVVDGDVYCLAGFGSSSDWYRNLLANPEVEIWLPDGWWAGSASDVSGSERRMDLLREVLIASGFAAWLAGIRPRTDSDPKFAAVTEEYRLLRIRRSHALTGRGGPGDLAWIWPLATMILLLILLLG
jgi:deazaflavin-dependent oxidoreductase (nitroreductase family)